MIVTVNGEPHELRETATVAVVITSLEASGNGFAVAVNEEVVPRQQWDARQLQPGDRIEVLTAVQGG